METTAVNSCWKKVHQFNHFVTCFYVKPNQLHTETALVVRDDLRSSPEHLARHVDQSHCERSSLSLAGSRTRSTSAVTFNPLMRQRHVISPHFQLTKVLVLKRQAHQLAGNSISGRSFVHIANSHCCAKGMGAKLKAVPLCSLWAGLVALFSLKTPLYRKKTKFRNSKMGFRNGCGRIPGPKPVPVFMWCALVLTGPKEAPPSRPKARRWLR